MRVRRSMSQRMRSLSDVMWSLRRGSRWCVGGGAFLVPFGGEYVVVCDKLAHFSFVDDLVVDGPLAVGYLGGPEFHFYGSHVFGVFSTYLIE